MELDSWDLERRSDGAVLVRVPSCDPQGRQLPDAVFAFRPGDPQYTYWEQKFNQRRAAGASRTDPNRPSSLTPY